MTAIALHDGPTVVRRQNPAQPTPTAVVNVGVRPQVFALIAVAVVFIVGGTV